MDRILLRMVEGGFAKLFIDRESRYSEKIRDLKILISNFLSSIFNLEVNSGKVHSKETGKAKGEKCWEYYALYNFVLISHVNVASSQRELTSAEHKSQ